MDFKVSHYVEHAGTVRISGRTIPRKAAACAMHNLENRRWPLEFLCIGANANQQAVKAMGCLCALYERKTQDGSYLAFVPQRYLTRTVDPLTRTEKDKDCSVWKAVIVMK